MPMSFSIICPDKKGVAASSIAITLWQIVAKVTFVLSISFRVKQLINVTSGPSGVVAMGSRYSPR